MRLHLTAYPHTHTTAEYSTCAYTSKIVKFCRMMEPRGHELYLYAGEHNDAPCHEHVPIISEAERRAWFGKGFDTVHYGQFNWNPDSEWWNTYTQRTAAAILQRWQPGDLILLNQGLAHKPIIDRLAILNPAYCEPGVGYEGIFSDRCAYESNAWRHWLYGKLGIGDGAARPGDTVIPNYFDPNDFPHLNPGGHDRLLFLGRITKRKGPHIAAAIAHRAGMRLTLAGPGVISHTHNRYVADDVVIEGDHIDHVGQVNPDERAQLLADHAAVIVPTLYIEPFGGAAVEAMMAGTPVIAADYGAFTETVTPKVGRRFTTLEDAAQAVEDVRDLDPTDIRYHAYARYSLEAVAPMFEQWFTSSAFAATVNDRVAV